MVVVAEPVLQPGDHAAQGVDRAHLGAQVGDVLGAVEVGGDRAVDARLLVLEHAAHPPDLLEQPADLRPELHAGDRRRRARARHAAADEGPQLGVQPVRRHLGEVLVVDRRVAHVERAARRHVLGGGDLERAAHRVDQRVPVVGVDRHARALGPETVELVEQRVDAGLLRRHVSPPTGRRRGRRRRACDRSGGGTRSPTCTSSPAGCAAGRSTGRGRRPPVCR